MELKEILSYAKRWWWLIVLLTLCGGLGTWFWGFDYVRKVQTKQVVVSFSSDSEFEVARERYRVSTRFGDTTTIKFDPDAEVSILLSASNLDSAARFFAHLNSLIEEIKPSTKVEEEVEQSASGEFVKASVDNAYLCDDDRYQERLKELYARIVETSEGLALGDAKISEEDLVKAKQTFARVHVEVEAPQSRGLQGRFVVSGASTGAEARIIADSLVLASVEMNYASIRREFEKLIQIQSRRLDNETKALTTDELAQVSALHEAKIAWAFFNETDSSRPEPPRLKSIEADRLLRAYYAKLTKTIESRFPQVVSARHAQRVPGESMNNEVLQLKGEISVLNRQISMDESRLNNSVASRQQAIALERKNFSDAESLGTLESYYPDPSIVSSEEIRRIRSKLNEIDDQDSELAPRHHADWPERKELAQRKTQHLEQLTAAIQAELDAQELLATQERNALNDSITARKGERETKLLRQHELEKKIRDQQVAYNLYVDAEKESLRLQKPVLELKDYLKSLERDRSQQDPTIDLARFSRSASFEFPSSSKIRATAVVTITMLAFSMLLVYLMNISRNKILSEYDVRRHMNLPVLAKIGRRPASEVSLLKAAPRSPAAETFSTIATLVKAYSKELSLQTLLISSAVKEEGKTNVASNLAIALARKGLKVLLIDTDMHRPRVESFFNKKIEVGFLQYCLDGIGKPITDYTTKIGQSLPHLMASGSDVDDPVKILESQEFNQMVEAAKEAYDVVLFDSPPITKVGDALILAGDCDGVLLVASAGTVSFAEAALTKRLLSGVQANILGVIINNSRDVSAREYYRYYSYGDQTRRSVHKVFD